MLFNKPAEQESPPPASGRQLSRSTLTQQVEDALRMDIIEGILSPGTRLRAVALSQRYGVSATPLREALQRLAAQNLVEIDPRLGATVADVSLPEFRDIYEMRDLLEGNALERAIKVGDEAWEARLTRAWEALRSVQTDSDTVPDVIAWSSAHRAFHHALIEGGDSPWLIRFVDILADHSERYRILSARSHTRASLTEHQVICEAALRHDAESAVRELREHLRRTLNLLG